MHKKNSNNACKCITSKKYLLKSIGISIILLLLCLFAISFFKRNHCFIKSNAVNSTNELMTAIIFDDIKIKINKDMFSHDSIMNDEINNELSTYLKYNVKKGDTIVDVNYDIGIYSLLMAKLAEQAGRIYVYNPCAKYIESLKASALENNFENRIIVNAIGIADHSFDGLLVYKNNFPIMSGRLEKIDYKVPIGYSAMTVKVSSIDEQLPKLQNIDFLRINVNGDEGAIIDGAINLIKKSEKIKIILSFNHETFLGYNSLEKLQLLGFNLYHIKANNILTAISIMDLEKIQKGYLLLKK